MVKPHRTNALRRISTRLTTSEFSQSIPAANKFASGLAPDPQR